MTRGRVGALGLVLSVLALGHAPAARSVEGSLPSVRTGARPGPAVLYAPRPKAPQLENRDARFKAAPLLVAGNEAYVGGEYVYQDYLYDDWGADTAYQDTAGADSDGDIDYPTNAARFGGNAADLVEFRVAPGRNDVAYRVTLNTLLVRDSSIVAIAFDTDRKATTGSATLPVDPGAPFPGTDQVITAWGAGGQHARWTSSGWKTRKVDVRTDLASNQMTITVPRSISNPRGEWRTTVAVGLYDDGWLRPQAGDPTATTPGGGPASGIFNLAFRFNEEPAGLTPMDVQQATAIADGAPMRFARYIDFAALDRKVSRSTVPAHGTIVRIFPSRLKTEGGKDYTKTPETRGQLQQYSLYVPTKYRPNKPSGFTLMLHSLGEHHWQYNGSTGIQQVGEQRTNLVATPEARGEDGWYLAEAEYDVFEVWNDVAKHYKLDPARAAVSGYSMGGYGTYRFGSLWPDLFGAAFSTVGPPTDGIWAPPLPAFGDHNTNIWLENTRNVPFLNVVGMLDELVPYAGTRAQNLGAPEQGIRGFEQLGYRYRFVTYPTGEHFTIAVFSYDTPYAAEFLGSAKVNRNPRHVTLTYVPATDFKELGLVHNHAYWVSRVKLAGSATKGTVDAFSHASGRGDPVPVDRTDAGVGPLPYFELGNDWGDAPKIRKENKLTLKLSNVGGVRLDLTRAGIDLGRTVVLDLRTNVATTVHLAAPNAGWIVRVPAGERVLRLR